MWLRGIINEAQPQASNHFGRQFRRPPARQERQKKEDNRQAGLQRAAGMWVVGRQSGAVWSKIARRFTRVQHGPHGSARRVQQQSTCSKMQHCMQREHESAVSMSQSHGRKGRPSANTPSLHPTRANTPSNARKSRKHSKCASVALPRRIITSCVI